MNVNATVRASARAALKKNDRIIKQAEKLKTP